MRDLEKIQSLEQSATSDDQKMQDIVKGLVDGMYKAAIYEGHINPKGKTPQQVRREVAEWFLLKSKKDFKMRFVIDHTPDLLQEAREYRRRKKNQYACLMYATWTEHWINSMVRYFAKKKHIDEKQIIEIIRGSNFNQKTTWLWRLLEAPSISSRHLKNITSLNEYRNSFVHYKWLGIDPEDEKQDRKRDSVVEQMEKTITYLLSYERRHVFDGKKSSKPSSAE
jgi:hypothetical protein